MVSFSHSAANLVAVRALARLAVGEAALRLDVVPLFETGADLEAASEVLDARVGLESTKRWLEGNGPSRRGDAGLPDSARTSARGGDLTLADAQRSMVDWAGRSQIEMTMFHGRGGSLGRGGGPLHRAITAQPRFGERPAQGDRAGRGGLARYADTTIAQRHLERLTTAVLLAGNEDVQAANAAAAQRYTDLAQQLITVSRETYRRLVETPGFADVLAQASPLEEIGELRLGSRPVRRSGASSGRSLSDLRAIPWVFAWSQTRANIPGWFGLGSALAAIEDTDMLGEAYRPGRCSPPDRYRRNEPGQEQPESC